MNIVVNGRNVEITPTLRAYAEDKIGKFDRYLSNITEAVVTLSIQKYRHKAEVLIKANGNLIQAEGVTEELYSSIDEVAQKLERQIKKFKGKIKSHRKSEGRAKAAEPGEKAPVEGSRTIISRPLDAKPMSPDEAAIQIEMGNREFVAFVNDQSGDVNVIYRRSDGNLGLIEPTKK
ncbi:MAG: ribosome-associated translation inhibitor RaiA [Nitrospirota bacterium]|jgi:putative sigma-54 modulation protein